MSYELRFKHNPDYLSIHASGIRTLENIIGITLDYIAERDKHGYRKVLLDVREMTGKLSTIDAYNLGTEELEKFRRTGEVKVSIIDLEDNRERFQFMENVATNMGLNLRIFSDVDKALKWLGVDESPTRD